MSAAAGGISYVSPVNPARIRLNLIGGLQLTAAGSSVPLPSSVERLVAFIALQERERSRAYVAGSLWLDSPGDRSGASLRTTLWRLRQLPCRLIDVSLTRLQLNPEVVVDVRDIFRAARRLFDNASPSAQVDASVLPSLVQRGELLPDWYDEWVVLERERLRHLRLQALEMLGNLLLARRDYPHAIEAALAAVAEEPLRESAQELLIRAHLQQGNRIEALRQFRKYRDLVHSELGLAPTDAIVRLIANAGLTLR
jgi:DNA-binding SARP family transcriptional activator